MQDNQRLYSLQALRAIAAMLVCFCHLPFSLRLYSSSFNLPYKDYLVLFDPLFNSGVDIFFVISGFVMTYVVANKKIDFAFCKSFAFKRILRIYPMYWIVMTVYALYSFIFGGGPFHEMKQIAFSYLLLPGYRVMPLSWTLTFEMVFYTIFTISMLISIIKWDKTYLAVLLISIFYFVTFIFPPSNDVHGIIQSPILYEFVIGVFLAKIFIKKIFLTKKYAYLFILAYLMIAAWNVLLPMSYINTYSWEHIARWGGGSALLVYALLSLEFRGVTFPNILLRIGDSSYSLYLLNSVLMAFFVKFWIKFSLPAYFSPQVLPFILVFLSISISYLAYIVVEKPMLKLSYKKLVFTKR